MPSAWDLAARFSCFIVCLSESIEDRGHLQSKSRGLFGDVVFFCAFKICLRLSLSPFLLSFFFKLDPNSFLRAVFPGFNPLSLCFHALFPIVWAVIGRTPLVKRLPHPPSELHSPMNCNPSLGRLIYTSLHRSPLRNYRKQKTKKNIHFSWVSFSWVPMLLKHIFVT